MHINYEIAIGGIVNTINKTEYQLFTIPEAFDQSGNPIYNVYSKKEVGVSVNNISVTIKDLISGLNNYVHNIDRWGSVPTLFINKRVFYVGGTACSVDTFNTDVKRVDDFLFSIYGQHLIIQE